MCQHVFKRKEEMSKIPIKLQSEDLNERFTERTWERYLNP